MRQVSDLKQTPVVAIAEEENMGNWLKAKATGVRAFITKPIENEEILNTAKKFVSSSSNNDNKKNQKVNKYRGVSYLSPDEETKALDRKSTPNKKLKKYRGITYN